MSKMTKKDLVSASTKNAKANNDGINRWTNKEKEEFAEISLGGTEPGMPSPLFGDKPWIGRHEDKEGKGILSENEWVITHIAERSNLSRGTTCLRFTLQRESKTGKVYQSGGIVTVYTVGKSGKELHFLSQTKSIVMMHNPGVKLEKPADMVGMTIATSVVTDIGEDGEEWTKMEFIAPEVDEADFC